MEIAIAIQFPSEITIFRSIGLRKLMQKQKSTINTNYHLPQNSINIETIFKFCHWMY